MAKATAKTVITTRVTLELSEAEVDVLLALCGRVAGSPVVSARKHVHDITTALRFALATGQLGPRANRYLAGGGDLEFLTSDSSGELWFTEGETSG